VGFFEKFVCFSQILSSTKKPPSLFLTLTDGLTIFPIQEKTDGKVISRGKLSRNSKGDGEQKLNVDRKH